MNRLSDMKIGRSKERQVYYFLLWHLDFYTVAREYFFFILLVRIFCLLLIITSRFLSFHLSFLLVCSFQDEVGRKKSMGKFVKVLIDLWAFAECDKASLYQGTWLPLVQVSLLIGFITANIVAYSLSGDWVQTNFAGKVRVRFAWWHSSFVTFLPFQNAPLSIRSGSRVFAGGLNCLGIAFYCVVRYHSFWKRNRLQSFDNHFEDKNGVLATSRQLYKRPALCGIFNLQRTP